MAPLAAPSSTTPWALFIAIAYLIFLMVRDGAIGVEESLLLEFSNNIEIDACKSPSECGPRFNGTTPFTDPDSGRMVWRSGNKVWVKIDRTRQIPMIIYDRIYPSREDDSRWTAIDNGRRMQELDLSNAAIYSAKPFRLLHKEAFEGLTAKEREDAMKVSYEICEVSQRGTSGPIPVSTEGRVQEGLGQISPEPEYRGALRHSRERHGCGIRLQDPGARGRRTLHRVADLCLAGSRTCHPGSTGHHLVHRGDAQQHRRGVEQLPRRGGQVKVLARVWSRESAGAHLDCNVRLL